MIRELTYREIIREFLLFLKKENAYKEYIKAIKQQKKVQFKNWGNEINVLTIHHLEKCFRNGYGLGSLIDNAFHWDSTEEGFDFWSELDKKWRDKMKDTEIVAEKINK